jgi:small subunit ribosomal protein S6e
MKINVSNSKNGCQKVIDIEDENILRIFYEKNIKSEINVSDLGPEWEGYVLKINGGQDKQGFPMKPGVLTNRRVKLLLNKGTIGCKGYDMKKGERRRKSVRGCIVSPEIGLLNVSIIKEGKEIPGLSNDKKKNAFLSKRASKIRKFYALTKEDDLKKYIVKESICANSNQKEVKYPKIQRLITPLWIQRKRFRISKKKNKFIKTKNQLIEYGKFLNKIIN